MNNPKGDIKFENATFSYYEDSAHVLNNFTLHIEAGKRIALIGETGVGKSTISKLIPRFYDLNSGKILIDDIDVKEYELNSLRDSIGHVQQDVYIFYGTIKENILYGKPSATDEEIIEAAKKANIHDFIMSLEHGYDTLTGDRGVKLSGGQKQRIAIARLFLKQPKILVLDEATSALDNETERIVQRAFDTLAVDKTIIIIAHQMSIIERICNKVAILSDHKVVEQGDIAQAFLNPQTDAAKSLIYSGHVRTKLHDSHLLKLEFNGDTDSPVIANIIQDCNILVSIVYANSFVVEDKIYGQMIIKLPYYDNDIDKLKTYLNIKGIKYKEVSTNELDESFRSH